MAQKKISRIHTFDILRGYFLIGIFMNHLNYYPNGLDWWAARGGLFVTMAEGFFIVSGVMLGIVRGAKLIDEPFKKVAKLLLNRGFQLYATSIILTLIFTFIVWIFFSGTAGVKPGVASADISPWQLLWDTVTLQYLYGWADYLRLYGVFILASPIMMWLLRRGRWYVGLLISFGVWMLFPDPAIASHVDQERAQLLSWQLLFFISMTIGFYWPQLQDYWTNLTQKTKRIILGVVWGLTTVTLLYSTATMIGTMGVDMSWAAATPEIRHELWIRFFDKERLPLVRIGLAMLWFWAGFAFVRHFEKPIKKWFGWLLISFGTNSLYVYIVHAFMLLFIHIFIPSGSVLFNLAVVVVSLGITLLMVRYKVLMKIIPR